MVDSRSTESALDAVAETVGEGTIEAFEILANEKRLAILLALWESYVPFSGDNAVTFSNLYDRVELHDTGNFTYHLDKLVGPFVEQTDQGYSLTTRAEQILHAVFAGTLSEYRTFEHEPIETECDRCGAPLVIDYRDSVLVERCTSCNGRWWNPDTPTGLLKSLYRPPVGLKDRTPQEFHRHGNTWDRYQFMSMLEGVCPECSGNVDISVYVCEDHDLQGGSVCEHCRSFWEMRLRYVCKVCKHNMKTAPFAPIHTDLRVKVFYQNHGLDPDELYDSSAIPEIHETIEEMTVASEDPLEVLITIAIDDDRLQMTLNDEGRVIDVTESSG